MSKTGRSRNDIVRCQLARRSGPAIETDRATFSLHVLKQLAHCRRDVIRVEARPGKEFLG